MKSILFHVDEVEKWELAVKNGQNLLAYYQKTNTPCRIEIVANSDAVKGLIKKEAPPALEAVLRQLHQSGATIAACNNTVQQLQLAPDDLFDFTIVVAAGVAEIAEKQFEGYAYIKP